MRKQSTEVPLRRRDEARALFRNAILEAAEGVFAEQGFHGARIQDVAERARVGVGTVYNHFAQKEDLLRALIDERTEALLAELRPVEGEKPDFPSRLTARLTRVLTFVDTHRSFMQVMMNLGITDRATDGDTRVFAGKSMKRIERFRAAFREVVEEGIAAGAIEPLDAGHLAAFLGGAIRAFAVDTLIAEQAPAAERARLISRLFLRGAGKR